MELKFINGDYVKNKYHDLETVNGIEETAQRIMMKLKARKGGFALMPEYGSRLYTLGNEKPAQRESLARQYIAEALQGEDVILDALRLIEDGDAITLCLSLVCSGRSISITTEI